MATQYKFLRCRRVEDAEATANALAQHGWQFRDLKIGTTRMQQIEGGIHMPDSDEYILVMERVD